MTCTDADASVREAFTAIADAIRSRTGYTEKLSPAEMAEAIGSMSTGSGGSGGTGGMHGVTPPSSDLAAHLSDYDDPHRTMDKVQPVIDRVEELEENYGDAIVLAKYIRGQASDATAPGFIADQERALALSRKILGTAYAFVNGGGS